MRALCLLIATIIVVAHGENLPAGNVTQYVINLDLPPQERWTEIVQQHKTEMANVLAFINDAIPAKYVGLAEEVAAKIDDILPSPYNDELRGVSTQANITLGAVVLLNLLYELTSYCTSIVAQAPDGTIYHGRNLDYNLASVLETIAVEISFQAGGVTQYTGTTYAGYVGLLTGMSNDGISVSLDERDQGNPWENAFAALFGKGTPTSMFMRTLLAGNVQWPQAVQLLATTHFIAPCYIIVGGKAPGEGAVITRDREQAVDVWVIDTVVQRWFLVETNYDHWLPAPKWDDRQDAAIKGMYEVGQPNINCTTIASVLVIPPVLNAMTTYTTLMSVAQGTYVTYLR